MSTPSASFLPSGQGQAYLDGTAFEDGARISQLVQPKVMVTYAVDPPAVGARARGILTRYSPELPGHSLRHHQILCISSGPQTSVGFVRLMGQPGSSSSPAYVMR